MGSEFYSISTYIYVLWIRILQYINVYLCIMDQNSTVYQRILCIMDQNSTVYQRILCIMDQNSTAYQRIWCIMDQNSEVYQCILCIMDQNSTVYQRIVCIMDQNSTVYQRILWIRILQYINVYLCIMDQNSTVYQCLLCTSSTAQGGGGSFKNRKPIEEIGCCESGMAERIHWWTERCLRSPLFLSLSYLSFMYLSIYRSIYLSLSLSSNYLST